MRTILLTLLFSTSAWANTGYQCASFDLAANAKGYLTLGWEEQATANQSLRVCQKRSKSPRTCKFSKCATFAAAERYLKSPTNIVGNIVDLHLKVPRDEPASTRTSKARGRGKSGEEIAGEAIADYKRRATCEAIQKAIGNIDPESCY